jgi:hypothetical protein
VAAKIMEKSLIAAQRPTLGWMPLVWIASAEIIDYEADNTNNDFFPETRGVV